MAATKVEQVFPSCGFLAHPGTFETGYTVTAGGAMTADALFPFPNVAGQASEKMDIADMQYPGFMTAIDPVSRRSINPLTCDELQFAIFDPIRGRQPAAQGFPGYGGFRLSDVIKKNQVLHMKTQLYNQPIQFNMNLISQNVTAPYANAAEVNGLFGLTAAGAPNNVASGPVNRWAGVPNQQVIVIDMDRVGIADPNAFPAGQPVTLIITYSGIKDKTVFRRQYVAVPQGADAFARTADIIAQFTAQINQASQLNGMPYTGAITAVNANVAPGYAPAAPLGGVGTFGVPVGRDALVLLGPPVGTDDGVIPFRFQVGLSEPMPGSAIVPINQFIGWSNFVGVWEVGPYVGHGNYNQIRAHEFDMLGYQGIKSHGRFTPNTIPANLYVGTLPQPQGYTYLLNQIPNAAAAIFDVYTIEYWERSILSGENTHKSHHKRMTIYMQRNPDPLVIYNQAVNPATPANSVGIALIGGVPNVGTFSGMPAFGGVGNAPLPPGVGANNAAIPATAGGGAFGTATAPSTGFYEWWRRLYVNFTNSMAIGGAGNTQIESPAWAYPTNVADLSPAGDDI